MKSFLDIFLTLCRDFGGFLDGSGDYYTPAVFAGSAVVYGLVLHGVLFRKVASRAAGFEEQLHTTPL